MTRFALGSTAQADIAWEKDFEKAKRRAAAEGKLLFLDFYTDW